MARTPSSAAASRHVTGAGLAFKLRDEPRVAVAFFGDGATNIGTFHESLNLAQLWKTKTVFVCENNHWAESTPGWQHSPVWDDMSKRALAYDMRAIKVDGQDVQAVFDAAHEALEFARSGEGPVFLDVETYRMHGHFIGDPQVYRSKEDREEARETIRSCGCASASRSATTSSSRSTREAHEIVDASLEFAQERHRPAARRRAEERLCLRSPTARPSATRSPRRCATDDDVFIMGEDIAEMGGSMAVTQGLLDEFGPERVRNTPISEMAIVGAGHRRGDGGDAPGRRDHVRGLPDALARADRQPGGQAPLHVGRAAHRSADDPHAGRRRLVAGRAARAAARGVARPRAGPEGRVPSTPEDVRGLLWSSIYDDNPVIFFEHRLLYPVKGEVPDEIEPIPLGKARTIREGTDVTVIAIGPLVHRAVEAAKQAEEEGISVEIIDPRTLQPLDEDALVASVKKTNARSSPTRP